MSAKINAILAYILVSIFTMAIEYWSGVSLDVYHYLNIILESYSNAMLPLMPTTGPWADSAKDAISMSNMVRFFLKVLSSPIPLIAAIIVYWLQRE